MKPNQPGNEKTAQFYNGLQNTENAARDNAVVGRPTETPDKEQRRWLWKSLARLGVNTNWLDHHVV
jgi:hypothetical protein